MSFLAPHDKHVHYEQALKLRATISQLVFKNGGVIGEQELEDIIASIDYLFARGNPDVRCEDRRDVIAWLASKAKQNRQKIRQFNEDHNLVERAERQAREYKKLTKQKKVEEAEDVMDLDQQLNRSLQRLKDPYLGDKYYCYLPYRRRRSGRDMSTCTPSRSSASR